MIETEKVTAMNAKLQSKSSTGLSWFERIGYGFGDMSYNIIFQFVNAYLLFYYTDVGGIQPAVIATLFLVVRVLDAIFDPIMGLILDKTNTRWGKASIFAVGGISFCAIHILMFHDASFR